MRHPATVGPCRFTDVDRDLNVFHFCNSLIFTGVGYQPAAQPGKIRNFLSRSATECLIHAFVSSKLD